MKDIFDEYLSRKCYYVCLGLWCVGLLIYGCLRGLDISITQIWPYPCIVLTLLGVYCPGCGGDQGYRKSFARKAFAKFGLPSFSFVCCNIDNGLYDFTYFKHCFQR